MPELPEIEVSRIGITPLLEGTVLQDIVVRNPRLRWPVPGGMAEHLSGLRFGAPLRRGKYLMLPLYETKVEVRTPGKAVRRQRESAGGLEGALQSMFDATGLSGYLLIHLGMSGSLRFVPPGTPAGVHDHVDLVLPEQVLRYRDPRRFGLVLWHAGAEVLKHPLLCRMGIEPLDAEFTGKWLKSALANRTQAIKPAIMDANLVVGVGNIYAAESLFRAGISPRRTARRLSGAACERLVAAIRATLGEAIAAGGSSVRDYVHSDGGAGSFQLRVAVYGRAGRPCRVCRTPIKQFRQAGRSTFYCPECQRG